MSELHHKLRELYDAGWTEARFIPRKFQAEILALWAETAGLDDMCHAWPSLYSHQDEDDSERVERLILQAAKSFQSGDREINDREFWRMLHDYWWDQVSGQIDDEIRIAVETLPHTYEDIA